MSPGGRRDVRIAKVNQKGKIKVGIKTNQNKPTFRGGKKARVKAEAMIKTETVPDIIEIPEFPELKIKVVKRGNNPSFINIFTSMFNYFIFSL